MRLASPDGYSLTEDDRGRLDEVGLSPDLYADVSEAVAGADVVYTDTWVSMGQEEEKARRLTDFGGYTVDQGVMDAAPNAIFMHCLPAHRGEEVSAEVIDGPQSRIWVQAAHRQNAARGTLAWLLQHREGGV